MNLTDDDFTLFGLPQRFEQPRAAIDERWRALQVQVHPDRFAAQGAAAQRVAMQWATRVNEAHARLKSPLARAAYLCELRGVPIAANDNTAMPPAFLMEQMQWREALEEATGAAQLQALDDNVAAEEQARLMRLQQQLDAHPDTPAAAQTVREWMFLTKLRAELDARWQALDDADA